MCARVSQHRRLRDREFERQQKRQEMKISERASRACKGRASRSIPVEYIKYNQINAYEMKKTEKIVATSNHAKKRLSKKTQQKIKKQQKKKFA